MFDGASHEDTFLYESETPLSPSALAVAMGGSTQIPGVVQWLTDRDRRAIDSATESAPEVRSGALSDSPRVPPTVATPWVLEAPEEIRLA